MVETFFKTCLIPGFDGAFLSPEWRDALWVRFTQDPHHQLPGPNIPPSLDANTIRARYLADQFGLACSV